MTDIADDGLDYTATFKGETLNDFEARSILALRLNEAGEFERANAIRIVGSDPGTVIAVGESYELGYMNGYSKGSGDWRLRSFRRGALLAFAITYLFCGINIGMTLRMAVPATSWRGVAYIAAIWPVWIGQPWSGYEPPVPRWAFDFDKPRPAWPQ